MLSNQEIDAFTFNDHKFSLAHKAALHGQLGVLTFLVGDVGLPLTALQLSDDSFSTPAMLAIQVLYLYTPSTTHIVKKFLSATPTFTHELKPCTRI